jgi:spermidine/putrescine transport system substrate-binding protein
MLTTVALSRSLLPRRTVLKGAALGSAALAAPAYVRQARAASGSLTVYCWGDYKLAPICQEFEKSTGIRTTLATYGSNEELENKLRASGGKGFDVIFPSLDNRANYDDGHLLMVLDEKKIPVSRIDPGLWRGSIPGGGVYHGQRYLIPHLWGTEGLAFDSTLFAGSYGELSYADLWRPGNVKKSAVRQKSVLIGLAIYLDAIGEVKSDRALDLYKSEADMRRVLDACLKFASEHKADIGAFWNDGTEARTAFTEGGCTIGQVWDSTGFELHKANAKYRYLMPKEGGLGWVDAIGIPSGAANVEQAYAFINFLLAPKVGAQIANNTGYNSVVVGASAGYSQEHKDFFAASYPGSSIANLWFWPPQPAYFSKVRQEYVEKLTNA